MEENPSVLDRPKNLLDMVDPKMPKYISPHLEKMNMNWRKLERVASPMGKGHMQIRKVHKNYFNKLFNLGKIIS